MLAHQFICDFENGWFTSDLHVGDLVFVGVSVLLKPELLLFPFVSRAFARVGNAYQKKEDFSNAVLYYNKSLSEHRDPEIVKKAQEVSMKADLIFCTAMFLFHIRNLNINIISILVAIEVMAFHM